MKWKGKGINTKPQVIKIGQVIIECNKKILIGPAEVNSLGKPLKGKKGTQWKPEISPQY